MCGIVGYVGQREAEPILARRPAAAGISRLRQRRPGDADRASICICARRRAGSPTSASSCATSRLPAASASATRAGPPTAPPPTRNAHPHLSSDGQVAVVHNGVIENYAVLKRQLQDEGVVFHSDTDTEVIAQLIAQHLQGRSGRGRAQASCGMLKGTYGLAVVSPRHPDVIVGARLGSPLVRRHRRRRELPGQRSRRPWSATPKRSSTCRTARCAC